MSGRTLTQFALVGLLATVLTSPVAAQSANPWRIAPGSEAPMPREKVSGEFGIEITLGTPKLFNVEFTWALDLGPVVAPMPRPKGSSLVIGEYRLIPLCADTFQDGGSPPPSIPAPPCCAFDYPLQTVIVPLPPQQVYPVTRNVMDGNWFVQVGPGAGGQQATAPQKLVVGDMNTGLVGGPPMVIGWSPPHGSQHSFPGAGHPLLGVTTFHWDESGGGWWVETVRVPQPRKVPTAPSAFSGAGSELRIVPTASTACCGKCQDLQVNRAGQFMVSGSANSDLGVKSCCAGTAVGSVAAPTCTKAGKLAGTWVREVEGVVIAATFDCEEFKVRTIQSAEGTTVVLTLTADYAITKEGLVHGVITGIDVDVKRDPKVASSSPLAMEFSDVAFALTLQSMVDSPFSFRTRITSLGLMVSNVKASLTGESLQEACLLLGGTYKLSKDGTVPVPKAAKTYTRGVTRCDGPAPTPPYSTADRPAVKVEDPLLGTPATQTVPTMPTPTAPGCPTMPLGSSSPTPIPTGWSPPAPTNVPAPAFDVMVDVFGQMLNAKQTSLGGMTLPDARYLDHVPQYGAPQPAPPCPIQQVTGYPCCPMTSGTPGPVQPMAAYAPAPLPAQPLTGTNRQLTGTWVREVGPVTYVIQIAAEHLTITATAATEIEDGKVATEGMILTGDYHLTRDGTTLVGLLTSADVRLDGDLPSGNDVQALGEDLARIQKMVTDKPFALSVRVYGDALVIGNVRLPEVNDPSGSWSPLTVLGGRYVSAGNKPLPKPRTMKAPTGPLGYYPPPPPFADFQPGYPVFPPGGAGVMGSPYSGPVPLPQGFQPGVMPAQMIPTGRAMPYCPYPSSVPACTPPGPASGLVPNQSCPVPYPPSASAGVPAMPGSYGAPSDLLPPPPLPKPVTGSPEPTKLTEAEAAELDEKLKPTTFNAGPAVPTMTPPAPLAEPTAPVPTMPEPTPLPSEAPRAGKKGKKKQTEPLSTSVAPKIQVLHELTGLSLPGPNNEWIAERNPTIATISFGFGVFSSQ